MRYDILKCNNLRFRYDRTEGIVKVHGNDIVLLTDETWLDTYGNIQRVSCDRFFSPEDFYEIVIDDTLKEDRFEIIPRNPNTYYDFQVGDKVSKRIIEDCEESDITVYEVAARINDVIFLTNSLGVQIITTCQALKNTSARLVLTDYEKELMNAAQGKISMPSTYDVILARDKDGYWFGGQYLDYDYKNHKFRLIVPDNKELATADEWAPYNESTYKLFMTKENYKNY